MVDAVNNALSHIAANSIYNVEAKTGGPLVGDSLARNLQAKIFSTMRELPSGSTLSSVGISIERNGTLSFDEAAFGEALAADPEGRSEEHTSELQSLMRISYAVFCLKQKTNTRNT